MKYDFKGGTDMENEVKISEEKLTDEQLESVSGGSRFNFPWDNKRCQTCGEPLLLDVMYGCVTYYRVYMHCHNHSCPKFREEVSLMYFE